MVIFHELQEGFICGSYDTSTAIGLSFKLRVLKLTKNFEIFFHTCVCSADLLQIERLLQRTRKHLLKKRKASCKDHWVCMYVSCRSIVKLHLQIFWSIIYVFRNNICVIWIFIFDGNTAQ